MKDKRSKDNEMMKYILSLFLAAVKGKAFYSPEVFISIVFV